MSSLTPRLMPAVLLLALLTGCARPSQPATPAPPPPAQSATQPAEPQASAPLAYTLQVNGKSASPGTAVEADFGEPVELLLQFAAPVAKATLEPLQKRLPEGALLTFPDEQSAHLLVWRWGSFAVDLNGIRTQDGKGEVQGAAPVRVSREPYARATLYRVEDLLAGRREFAARWRLPYRPLDGFALSPDRTQALLFKTDPMVAGPAPSLLDLATGANRPLGLKEGEYANGGWLPDGRLFLQGETLWLSGDGGKSWTAGATGLRGMVSTLSPQGSHIAIWSYPSRVLVVEVKSGAKVVLEGPFRRPAQDGAPTLAWSPDGQWLAGSDSDSDAGGQGSRIRVVDPFGSRPGRTIEGPGLIGWMPDGRLLGFRRTPERKGPESGELLLIGPNGGEERLLLDRWARPSPDGRYLAYTEWDGQMPASYLVEVASGKRSRIPLLSIGRWTERGELLVIEGPFQ